MMRIRVLLLLLLTGALSGAARAQTKSYVSSAGYFQQRVTVQSYAGRPYRLTARIKVETTPADSGAANLIAAVYGRNNKLLAVQSLNEKRARSAQWQTYTVAGPLPGKAETLEISGLYHLGGTFSFDDFQLQVQEQGTWKNLSVVNGDFRQAASDSTSGFPNGWRLPFTVPTFTFRTMADSEANTYLQVQGRSVVDYGRNRAAGHFAAVNGVRIHYEIYGQGEPLLLLHGNGQSIGAFSNQIPELAKHYRVIAVDTRAQGQSTDARAELSYDLFAADMNALLDSLHLPAAHVVGWSDGGNTGLSMALHYPARVKKLVTMGANLYADTTAVQAGMLKQVRQDKLLLTVLGPFRKDWHRAYKLTKLLLKYPQLQPAQLGAITAPTLVLAGEKDLIREAHSRLIAASIPRGQVRILPALTHYAPQENPALFNQTVLEFLQKP